MAKGHFSLQEKNVFFSNQPLHLKIHSKQTVAVEREMIIFVYIPG